MATKCLAFIWPAEDITGKDECLSNVKFLSGPFKHKILQYQMTTSIYRYYYWGVTFEVVTINDKGELINVRDVNVSDMNQFDIKVIQAYAFNSETHEILGSNGFIYKLDQSLFYRHCPAVCEYIYSQMETAKNFTLDMYTLNGGIISILFDKDLTPKNKLYKNAIHRGFVSWDKDILKNMAPPVSEEVYSDEKLGQDDIDKLIEKLSKVL